MAFSWFALGSAGSRRPSVLFVLGGRGGTLVPSLYVLGGSGGGAFLPSCCNSTISDSLGSKRISSSKNGIGGGRSLVPSGLWGRDNSSSWIGREPGREIDMGEHDIFVAQNLIKNYDLSILEVAWL